MSCKQCGTENQWHKFSCHEGNASGRITISTPPQNPKIGTTAIPLHCKQCNLTKGHKMDCSEARHEVIKAPTILAVKDEKHHMISHTIVDYDRIEEIMSKIKELEERNGWHHEITVLPSERFFLSDLAQKGTL
jgi:hypothetical protein